MADEKLVERLVPLWEQATQEGLDKAANVLGVPASRIEESPEHYIPLMMGALLKVCAEEIEKATARLDELERVNRQRDDYEREQYERSHMYGD